MMFYGCMTNSNYLKVGFNFLFQGNNVYICEACCYANCFKIHYLNIE